MRPSTRTVVRERDREAERCCAVARAGKRHGVAHQKQNGARAWCGRLRRHEQGRRCARVADRTSSNPRGRSPPDVCAVDQDQPAVSQLRQQPRHVTGDRRAIRVALLGREDLDVIRGSSCPSPTSCQTRVPTSFAEARARSQIEDHGFAVEVAEHGIGLSFGIVTSLRDDDPDVRALVPRPTLIIAQHRLNRESGALQAPGHLRHRECSEREREAVNRLQASASLDISDRRS